MDPLTAVSLAGTVVQFVDFTSKLISAGGQLYEAKELEVSRVAKESAERIRLLATSSITNLQNYRLKLQAKLSADGGDITLTRDDSLLEDICRKCTAEAEVLIARLQKLEVPIDAKHRGWQSLEMALRSVSSQKEIERMNQKLVDYRAQISSQIIVSLSERLDLITLQHSDHFQSVGRENRQIISALFSLQSTVTDNLQSQATALSRLLDRSEVVIADREDRTRKLIVDIFQDTPSSGGNSERLRSLRDEEKSLRVSVGVDILESLRFPTITERFEDVAEAHRKTFQWIFRTTHIHLDQAWSDFPHWLQHEDGLYWINGKLRQESLRL